MDNCSATIHALRTSQNSIQMQFMIRVKFCMKLDPSQNQSGFRSGNQEIDDRNWRPRRREARPLLTARCEKGLLMVGWRAAGGVDLGGRGAGRRLFWGVWDLSGWCWSVWGCGTRAKGAEFGGAGGPSATVRSLAFHAPAFCSGRQSPRAGWGCARICGLISAAQGGLFGLTKRFWLCRRSGGWP
eukprot:COSAG02_NODE_8962_length_2380_cov_40.535292_1_plen_185_part_00